MENKANSSEPGQTTPKNVGSAKELYERCKTGEKDLKSCKSVLTKILKDKLYVDHPLFLSAPLVRHEVVVKRIKARYPFDSSIIKPSDVEVSEAEWRYNELLKCLKELDSRDMRLLCVSRWLKQEGICEPEDLLDPKLFAKLLRLYRKREKISEKAFYHWHLVNVWLPYFERLLRDRRNLPKTNRDSTEALVKLGYEQSAVVAASDRREAVPATVFWLETQKNMDARTLENAYSHVEVSKRTSRLDLP